MFNIIQNTAVILEQYQVVNEILLQRPGQQPWLLFLAVFQNVSVLAAPNKFCNQIIKTLLIPTVVDTEN